MLLKKKKITTVTTSQANETIYDDEVRLAITGPDGAVMGDEHGVQFAQRYEEYFINQCNSDLSKVRKIKSIDFGYAMDRSDGTGGATQQYLQMNKNFAIIFVNAFRLQCFQIDSFKQFFKIFHCNLKECELLFYGGRFNSVENMFFKSNSIIYNEITKIDKHPKSFDGIAWVKHQIKRECASTNDHCGDEMMLDVHVESLLPNINELHIIDEINQRDNGVVFAKFNYLLNHPKILALLNIRKSVTKLALSLDGLQTFMDAKFDCIVDTISQVGKKFDKLHSVEVVFNGEISEEDLFKNTDQCQDAEKRDAIMIEMLNKCQSFFNDGYFDKILKILIENNIKMFQITWQTMNAFYKQWAWGEFQHRELIEIDVAGYNNCNKNVCNNDIGLVSGLYDDDKMKKALDKFHECCSVSKVNFYAWRWVTKVIIGNSNDVE